MKKNSPAIIGQFEGKCCDSNVFNNNDMKLGRDLFEYLFASEDYKRAMENRYYIGFLGHPEDPNCMDFKDACIVMTDCYIDNNGEVYGKFDLIDTPVGRVVKSFIDAGVIFGISIRGAGDLDMEGNVDPETFVFRGFDLVTFPAYDDCVPEFKEIAASSSLEKQVKYKKVCSTIKHNLSKITSCNALEIIQDQFKDGTEEFIAVGDRISELGAEDNLDEAIFDPQLAAQKLEGMTDLYLEAVEENRKLADDVAELVCQNKEIELTCSRKLESFKRIISSQMCDMEDDRIQAIEASRKATKELREIKAINSRLKREVKASNSLKEANLKYSHKIEANSKAISQKDSTISNLEKELSETVAENRKLKIAASNRDEELNEWRERVEAAEQMVFDYQTAYANMYANALGVHLEDLSITAATSVKQLQDLICASTSTAGIPAAPSIDYEDGEEDIELASLGDDYSDMITM